MYVIKYSNQTILNRSIWNMDGIQTGNTAPVQSGPGSTGNEEVVHTSQSFRTGTLLPDSV